MNDETTEATALVSDRDRLATAIQETTTTPRRLAEIVGVPFDAKFRRTLWCVFEEIRKRSGHQYRIRGGNVVRLTPEEALRYAGSTLAGARRKKRRGKARLEAVAADLLPAEKREALRRALEKVERDEAIERLYAHRTEPIETVKESLKELEARRRAERKMLRGGETH